MIFTGLVYLVIRQKYVLILIIQMFGLILPLFFFVTILKKFIPNKIATDYCLKYSIICIRMNSISLLLLILLQLKHSVYAKPLNRKAIVRSIERCIGSFRLYVANEYIHSCSNFRKIAKMTVNMSLIVSCTTIFIRQGITLHYDPQNKTAIYQNIRK